MNTGYIIATAVVIAIITGIVIYIRRKRKSTRRFIINPPDGMSGPN